MRSALAAVGLVLVAVWALPAAAQPNGFEEAVRQQHAEELQRRKEEDWKKSDDAIRATQARFREEVRKTVELARTLPVVPAARNPVLGKWMTEASQRPKPKEMDFFGQINEIGNSAVCSAMLADGVVKFRAQDWAIDDFDGDDSLGPVSYRGKGEMIYVVPAAGIQVIAFAVEGKDRLVAVQLSGSEPCALFRVPQTTTYATRPRPGRTVAASAGAAPGRTTGQQIYNPPTPVYAEVARPPAEVCNRTFVDQLGKARAQAVRDTMKLRFKEIEEGVTPGTRSLRLAGRGSPCDEAAIDAVWYDFDAGGLLSHVTYVWKRQAGPDIYGYLSTQTGRFATAPPRVTRAGRTEGTTALYRYLIEDRPQQQAVLITYTALTP